MLYDVSPVGSRGVCRHQIPRWLSLHSFILEEMKVKLERNMSEWHHCMRTVATSRACKQTNYILRNGRATKGWWVGDPKLLETLLVDTYTKQVERHTYQVSTSSTKYCVSCRRVSRRLYRVC